MLSSIQVSGKCNLLCYVCLGFLFYVLNPYGYIMQNKQNKSQKSKSWNWQFLTLKYVLSRSIVYDYELNIYIIRCVWK